MIGPEQAEAEETLEKQPDFNEETEEQRQKA